MALSITQVPIGGFDENFSYLITDETSGEGLLVDPSGSVEQLLAAATAAAVLVRGHLITHTHFDHIDGLDLARERFPTPVYVHEAGTSALTPPLAPIVEGTMITLGGGQLTVMHAPGHSSDSVCFFVPATDAADGIPKLISGDTLFVSRCGRTDRTHVAELYDSLQRLKTLPPETVIYPGHDYGETPTTTLAHECSHNQFLTAPDQETFTARRLP